MWMTIDEHEVGACCWRTVIRLNELPGLLQRFREKEPKTEEVEQQAKQLVAGEFQFSDLQQFIKDVCKWGGYPGVAGRVIKNNVRSEQVRCSFQIAYSKAVVSDDIAAIEALRTLKGLGISFASKHLKFLAPERAVVLDSIISTHLGYPMTPEGYQTFVSDCRRILDRVVADNLEYTGWGTKRWRISDVEMAIYEKLREDARPNSREQPARLSGAGTAPWR